MYHINFPLEEETQKTWVLNFNLVTRRFTGIKQSLKIIINSFQKRVRGPSFESKIKNDSGRKKKSVIRISR